PALHRRQQPPDPEDRHPRQRADRADRRRPRSGEGNPGGAAGRQGHGAVGAGGRWGRAGPTLIGKVRERATDIAEDTVSDGLKSALMKLVYVAYGWYLQQFGTWN